MSEASLFDNKIWHIKCVEPIKRKHGSLTPEWQVHRFSIKGGISIRDAMIYDMMIKPNPFLKLMRVG